MELMRCDVKAPEAGKLYELVGIKHGVALWLRHPYKHGPEFGAKHPYDVLVPDGTVAVVLPEEPSEMQPGYRRVLTYAGSGWVEKKRILTREKAAREREFVTSYATHWNNSKSMYMPRK